MPLGNSGPSPGCGLERGATGELTLEVQGRQGEYVLLLPDDYDPSRAYPLGFTFHGANRTHVNCWQDDCLGVAATMQQEAILVFMRSFAAGWVDEAREINAQFFSELLSQIKADYCVDQGRVFAAGTSSGAHFTNLVGCRFGDLLLAAAPVAGYMPESSCVGNVAALVVHGIDDNQVPFTDGETARSSYLARNGCDNQAAPELAQMHARIRASRDQNQNDSACVDYLGCDEGLPVRWCEHSEGGYDGSTHGWPSVGGQLVWDFVQSL